MRAIRIRAATGFTLIEVLVALAIFSVIAVAAYRLLASTNALKERGDIRYRDLAQMQAALRLLEDDLMQLGIREARASDGSIFPAFGTLAGRGGIELTRIGRHGSVGRMNARVQRVKWTVDDEMNLVRTQRKSFDDASEGAVLTRVVAMDIDRAEFLFLDAERVWQSTWPDGAAAAQAVDSGNDKPDPRPLAVEIRLHHERLGEIVRLVPIR
jgi:general secretion pathway protein J